MIDKLENNEENNYQIINAKFIEKEPMLERMKSMLLYNRHV